MTGDDGVFGESSIPDPEEESTDTRRGMVESASKQGEEDISKWEEAENLVKPGTYEVTETAAASTGPAWICTRSCAYILWLLAWCFHGTPNSGTGVSMTLLSALGPPLPCLIQCR